MRIYAHRGASAQHPENTLAAFAHAIELGVEGIELDVRLSADGIPMVIHDDTVDRTTNDTGTVAELTASELGMLDAGHGEYVPTLREVLALAEGKVRVNIEIKDPASVVQVTALVHEFPSLEWFASSADWASLAELARMLPGCDVYPLTFARPALAPWKNAEPFHAQAAIDFTVKNAGSGVSIWERGLTQEGIDAIHHAGLEAWVWTVNDVERAKELMELGIDALCTDDPQSMLAFLGSHAALQPVTAAQRATGEERNA